jgi:hypothetical protein
MDEKEPKPEEEDVLIQILSDSGFRIVPLQTIIDALSEMETYLREQAGVSQEELEVLLQQVEDLVGKDEATKMDLDEILGWIRAVKS